MPTLQNTKYNKIHIDVRHREKLLDELRTVHAALYEKYLDGSFFEVLHALGLTAATDRTGNITGIYVDTDKCDVNRVLHLLTKVIAPYVQPGGFIVFVAGDEIIVIKYRRGEDGRTRGQANLLDKLPNTFMRKGNAMTKIISQQYFTEELSLIYRKSMGSLGLRMEVAEDDVAIEVRLNAAELQELIGELTRHRQRLVADMFAEEEEEAEGEEEEEGEGEGEEAEEAEDGSEIDPAEFEEDGL